MNIIKEDISTYKSRRLGDWESNADSWLNYVSQDTFREYLTNIIIKRLLLYHNNGVQVEKLLDLGCGDGSFLRQLCKYDEFSKLTGLDYCRRLLDLAGSLSSNRIEYIKADFEDLTQPLYNEFNVATSIFSFMEAINLERCFEFLSKTLAKNGLGVVVTLDPTNEIYKFYNQKSSSTKTQLIYVEDNLVISSHFNINRHPSPKPYYRVLHSLDRYLLSAQAVNLRFIDLLVAYDATGNYSFEKTKAIVIFFQKT